MKAIEARQLKVGDWVKASFGIYEKKCEIVAIAWPTFTLRTKDHKGVEMIRTRRYKSIYGHFIPEDEPPPKTPFWLVWPNKD